MLGAALIHPDLRAVIPLMPEPIVKHDGTDKNDCERNAAKRFVAKLRQDHPHLKFIVTEDSLSSNAPHIETLHAPRSALYPWGQRRRSCLFVPAGAGGGARRARHLCMSGTTVPQVSCIAFALSMRCRSMPRNADVRVNFIEYWEMGAGQGPTLQLGD